MELGETERGSQKKKIDSERHAETPWESERKLQKYFETVIGMQQLNGTKETGRDMQKLHGTGVTVRDSKRPWETVRDMQQLHGTW